MIKLSKILSEIKLIHGGLNADKVIKLYDLVIKMLKSNISRDLYKPLIDKKLLTAGTWEEDRNQIRKYEKTNPEKLALIYQMLLNYYNKNKINEIKLINPNQIPPEIVDKLDKILLNNIHTHELEREYMNIRAKYGSRVKRYDLKGMKKWTKNELLGLYLDILSFKNKHNL